MVRQQLCSPATRVPSEIVFSSSGYTVRDGRNQLHQLILVKMIVIHQFFQNQNFLDNPLKKGD